MAVLGLLAVLTAGPQWAQAQATPEYELLESPPVAYWSLQLENDMWGSGDDRYYTHGTEFRIMPAQQAPAWVRRWSDAVPFFESGDEQYLEFSFGQSIFTPEDTQIRTLIPSDRPYAGWLYASAAVISMLREEPDVRSVNSLELTLGIVGPSSLAEEVQSGWHDWTGADEPKGWDNQLHDEPGAVLTYTRMWEYFVPVAPGLELSGAPHLVGALGNVYTYAGVGAMARFGNDLRTDIGPPTIRPGFPGAAYFRQDGQWGWYLFAGFEARLVGRNIFLDGNTFEESHSVDKRPGVVDFQVGVTVRWENIRISLTEVLRTEEFEQQDGSSSYGSLNLTVLY